MRVEGLVRATLPLAAISFVVTLLLVLPLSRVSMGLPIDFGEGWNAYMADSAARGQAIYAPPGSLTPNNYPPLSFYLIGWLHTASGVPSLMLGRWLALLALVAVAIEVAWIARRLGVTHAHAWFGALVLVGLVAAAAPRYVAMNDPQWLAQAVITLGLVVYLAYPVQRHLATLAVMGAVMALALFTKHNLVALPLALTVDLGLNTRRMLVPWLLVLGSLLLALAWWLDWYTGGLMLSNILTPRRYEAWSVLRISGIALVAMAVPAAVTVVRLWGRLGEPHVRLIALYFAIAVVTGVVFAGGSGADVNMFFEAFVALSLGVALAQQGPGRGWPAMAVIAWLVLALLFRMPTPGRWEALRQREIDTSSDAAFVRAHAGLAFCEQMLVCYAAGKPLVLQPYFAPELIAAGAVPETVVSEMFGQRRFAVVQLDGVLDDRRSRHRMPPGVLAAVQGHYRLARTSSNGAFYVRAADTGAPDGDDR